MGSYTLKYFPSCAASPVFDTTVLRSTEMHRLPVETCPPPFPTPVPTTAHPLLTLRMAYALRPSSLMAQVTTDGPRLLVTHCFETPCKGCAWPVMYPVSAPILSPCNPWSAVSEIPVSRHDYLPLLFLIFSFRCQAVPEDLPPPLPHSPATSRGGGSVFHAPSPRHQAWKWGRYSPCSSLLFQKFLFSPPSRKP